MRRLEKIEGGEGVEIVQFAFNVGVVAYAVVSTICWRNQVKLNSANQHIVSILDQRVREIETAEKSRKG